MQAILFSCIPHATRLRNAICALLLPALLACPLAATAKAPKVPLSDLHQEPRYENIIGIINHIMLNYHYRKFILDDHISRKIFDNYLKSIDPNRMYFNARDIAGFKRYRTLMDDALRKRDLAPAYHIFRAYRRKLEKRAEYATGLLEKDFDFTANEDFQFDRRESPWAESERALDEIWRKKIKNDILNLRLSQKAESEIRDVLERRYAQLANGTQQLNSNDVFQLIVNAYTTAIEPHTSYFTPRSSENFDISMSLSLEGIGAVLRNDSEYTQVVRIITGGPADIQGILRADDRIIGVAQGKDGEMVDVVGMRLDDVVALIRGAKGSMVRLEILRNANAYGVPGQIISITRDRIDLEEQSAKSSIIDLPGKRRIGVIHIPTFYIDFNGRASGMNDYRSTSRDVGRLIGELRSEGINGLIIDLRGNGGGSLSEALEITGLFIDSGPVVQTRNNMGEIKINNDPKEGIAYLGPLAVLVDRDSASASEIFAGAIQDYQRGIIIGEPTFGKGTVQNIIALSQFANDTEEDYGKLKTTIAQFYRVSGGSNQYKGVVPDISFPLDRDSAESGERAHDNALPWDKIDPVEYRQERAPTHLYSLVEEKHRERTAKDELFQLMMKDAALIAENRKRTSITLLESKRQKEKESLEDKSRNIRNQMRTLLSLPLLPEKPDSGGNAPPADPEQQEREQADLDILLKEAAAILGDLINSESGMSTRLTAIRITPQ